MRLHLKHSYWLVGLLAIGCGGGGGDHGDGGTDGGGGGPTITLTGVTLDPERAVAARTGNLAALFGPADMTGLCWTIPCDNNEAFALAKLEGVTVGVFGHPEIPTVLSDKDGNFSLPGVPQKSKVQIVVSKPNDPIYLQTIDGVTVRTGTADLHGLPFHLCRNDKIFKALFDKEGPNSLDNGAVLAVINNNVPLPQNAPLTADITVTSSSGKVLYVGFDFYNKKFVLDDQFYMPNVPNASWLGAVVLSGATAPVSLMVQDTSQFADSVTGRPYTYPVYSFPLAPKSSTFVGLYPLGTGTK